MKIIEEFKTFALKGNVVDLAVGVIIGGAFGKIVTSFVNDILMPPLGLLLGGVNFSSLRITLQKAARGQEAVTFNYGNFLQTTIDFLIIAFAIFLFVRMMNRLPRRAEEAPQPKEPSTEEKLLTEIRDLLKNEK